MGFYLEMALGCCAGGLALWALAIAAFTYIESRQRSGQRADDGRRDTWS